MRGTVTPPPRGGGTRWAGISVLLDGDTGCVVCVYRCVDPYVHRWDTVPQYTELKVMICVYKGSGPYIVQTLELTVGVRGSRV